MGKFRTEPVEAVITSFNQGSMILEAVQSLCGQTIPPAGIIIVDDGSTDEESVRILNSTPLYSFWVKPLLSNIDVPML
mgnify:FL=1